MVEIHVDSTRKLLKHNPKKKKKTVGDRVPFTLFRHLIDNEIVYENIILAHNARDKAHKEQQREIHEKYYEW